MDGADEVIPRMTSGELANPIFVAREVIDFEGEFDFELGDIALGLADFFDVFIELVEAHAPVIEIVAIHGAVIGEADFAEADLGGVGGIFAGLAGGVLAERRVHVVIRR